MYNINWEDGMSWSQTLKMYPNLGSRVSNSTIDGNFLLLKFRGRKTNFQRNVIAYPTSSESYVTPTYDYNNRYWLIQLTITFATSGAIAGYDTKTARLASQLVLPIGDIYDIVYHYTTELDLRKFPNATTISGISDVFAPTMDGDYSPPASSDTYPSVYYTEYSENDLVSTALSVKGLPVDASVDNRDVEYGVQTWTPNY